MPDQVSPQAILPQAPDGAVHGSIIKRPYTTGKNLDTFFIDLPAQPCRQVVIINDSADDLYVKRSLHTNNDNDTTTAIRILAAAVPYASYTFDVYNASDISVRQVDANGAQLAVQFTIECKL